MKIEQITNQYRRDFTAIMQCEFCGSTQINNSGYDDRNYHDEVIPNITCIKCKESTISKSGIIDNTSTRYPEGFQV